MSTPQYILDFITAVCPEAPDLYMASFSERACLVDATKLIAELRQRVATVQAEVERLRAVANAAGKVKAGADALEAWATPTIRQGNSVPEAKLRELERIEAQRAAAWQELMIALAALPVPAAEEGEGE